jgi:hypothetical protein
MYALKGTSITMIVMKRLEKYHDGKCSFAPKSTKSDESRVTNGAMRILV